MIEVFDRAAFPDRRGPRPEHFEKTHRDERGLLEIEQDEATTIAAEAIQRAAADFQKLEHDTRRLVRST